MIVVLLNKTIKLNILPLTTCKEQMLHALEEQWLNVCNHLFNTLMYWDGFVPNMKCTRFNLQKLEYNHMKQSSGLQSQLIVDAIKDCHTSWNNKGLIEQASPSFNIPRSGGFKTTKHGNPVISIAHNGKRTAFPIQQDGAYQRFQSFLENGWITTHFRIKYNEGHWNLLVTIHREQTIRKDDYATVIGVDVGSRTLASISILKENNIVKQLYLGRDIWNKQRDIGIRRSKLQSHADKGDIKARKKLKDLKGYESDFVKTRCYETAHRIIELAQEYNAIIAIEDLKLNGRLNRKSNRRVKRMPYCMFRVALETVTGQQNIKLVAINPRYTSQICSRCGSLHKTSTVLYHCPDCGYTANRDRNASVNIAHVARLIFCTTINHQHSMGDAQVNGHDWKHDGEYTSCRRHGHSPDFKPLPSGRGS